MAQGTCYGLQAKSFDVKAMTWEASGRQLSSGAQRADIEGMRAAILLTLAATAASAASTGRVSVMAVVVPSVRFSQEIGAPVRKAVTAAGALYVLPMKGSVSAHGGGSPAISVEGAEAFLRETPAPGAGRSVEGDLQVFVPEGSDGRVVVTILADGAPPEVRRKR
jgi:hypothetical protein